MPIVAHNLAVHFVAVKLIQEGLQKLLAVVLVVEAGLAEHLREVRHVQELVKKLGRPRQDLVQVVANVLILVLERIVVLVQALGSELDHVGVHVRYRKQCDKRCSARNRDDDQRAGRVEGGVALVEHKRQEVLQHDQRNNGKATKHVPVQEGQVAEHRQEAQEGKDDNASYGHHDVHDVELGPPPHDWHDRDAELMVPGRLLLGVELLLHLAENVHSLPPERPSVRLSVLVVARLLPPRAVVHFRVGQVGQDPLLHVIWHAIKHQRPPEVQPLVVERELAQLKGL
eukprot:350208-Chlamydomonas_euryale.AAC.11